ncbi:MAG: serine/threonine protein kinase [Coriobacteriales bacterium]|jgi:serine/threonine-protein kinase|nr:serine/threonine protein kinase [Coriobacteriales bacterium]
MLELGTVIEDKYEILTLLGEGGMSRVYLARDRRLNKQWAIKEIKQTGDRSRDELIAKSFVTEANLMKRVDHPMLPRIVDIILHQGQILVVMDYIEGQSLSRILDAYGPQSPEDVVEWGMELCDALNYLHNQSPPIIYRDMKPGNIMLRPDGTIRIVDFGTAREYHEQALPSKVSDTTVLGTRGYAAPEQFGGVGQTDVRTDIYNIGATLYHLLTGINPADPPYEMVPIRQVNPNLSPGLEKVIAKCIQPNPAMRYQSCAELFYALQNYEQADDQYYRRQKRKLAAFITAASFTVLLLMVGVGSLIANYLVVNRTVEGLMQQAQLASDPSQAERFYLAAIELKPSTLPAYAGLIDLYKQDNVFSDSEEEVFQRLVVDHLSDMRSGDQESALLNYEVGILYLYYYSATDVGQTSAVVRAGYAKDWFAYARGVKGFNLHENADLFYLVCEDIIQVYGFESRMTLTTENYQLIYVDMLGVLDLAESQNDIVRIQVAEIVLNMLYECRYSFEHAGITTNQQFELFDQARSLLQNSNSPTLEYQVIKANTEQLIVNLQDYFETQGIKRR